MFIIILTMGQRIVISESEKNHIKNLYESDKLLNDIQKLKKQINDMKKYKKTELPESTYLSWGTYKWSMITTLIFFEIILISILQNQG